MWWKTFLHSLAMAAILSAAAAPAVAQAWNEIDLATLADKPDPSGSPGWYYPPDLPAMAQVPPHPEYGTLTALIPQGRRQQPKQYRPTYVKRVAEGCTLVETVILAGDYGELLADVARNPPPRPPGARDVWFAGPKPRAIQLNRLMKLHNGFDGMQGACPSIYNLVRTVDEADNLVAAFDNSPGMVMRPIERAAFLKRVPPAVAASPAAAATRDGASPADRLDPSKDVVAQLVAYAATLGIEEQDITKAIFSGKFVPAPDDLRLVLLKLGGVDCAAAFADLIEDPYVTLGQVQGFDCSVTGTARPGRHHDAWNSRFGTPGDEHLFVLASRLYYLVTRKRPDPRWVNQPWPEGAAPREAQELMGEIARWSAPYHFLWADQANPRRNLLGRYEKMRSDFLALLPARVSPEQLASIGLVAEASAIDAPGPDWPGNILALFLHGDWNRIDWIGRAHFISANGGSVTDWKPVASLPGGVNARYRFADIAAQWALARYAVLGDCGDPVTTMIHTSTPVTDWYRGRMFEGREYGHTSKSEFTALAGFADILIAAPATLRADIGRFERIAEAMGCDSDMRRAMEGNMRAHFEGRPPVFRSGL